MRKLLRLLADPTRLRILAALTPEELAVSEIAETLGMGQPRVSNHLRLLRDAGALKGRREGSWTFYRNALPERPDSGPLWQAVEAAGRDDPALAADAERRRAVLERRRERSRAHFAAAPAGGASFALGCLREEAVAALAPEGWTVVDAGCGDGYLTEALADRFARVIAVDHAPGRLEEARRRLLGRKVDFRLGEIDALPVPAASADAVFLSLVLHHVPELAPALREARRVLRRGGRVVAVDLAPHGEESLREEVGDLRLGLDPDRLAAALSAAGFSNVRRLPVRDRLRAGPRRELDLILVTGEHRGDATSASRARRPAPGGKNR
jgi:SAM-dependent methyltransferase